MGGMCATIMYGNDVTYFGRHIVYCTNVYNVCSGDDAIAPLLLMISKGLAGTNVLVRFFLLLLFKIKIESKMEASFYT